MFLRTALARWNAPGHGLSLEEAPLVSSLELWVTGRSSKDT